MIEGGSISVSGVVKKKSDMSFQGNILRVVSGNSWSSDTDTNHVETFDFTDLQNPVSVDGKTFGDNEDLFATLFLKNSAFFVTFERVDPFHTFSISDTGALVEESEFIVSGFNTWFRPVSDNTRLIGIGVDDKNGNRSPAVSLYDIEDLKNANPLVDREEVTSSWSDAIWDDKSFSVLEKSANVMSETNVLETGIVLLPFQGWDDAANTYKTGVQIFTFSDTTLTKRGVMLHDTPVTRTFTADRSKDLTGNLSNLELSLYNTADVDAPTEVSRLALAPNYTQIFSYGNHIARRLDREGYWNWWGNNGSTTATVDTIQIVAKGDIEDPLAVAEIAIPTNAILHKKDDLLVVVDQHNENDEITITTWNLSDPTAPELKDSLSTNEIPRPTYEYDYYDECYDCGSYRPNAQSIVVGNALVFEVSKSKEKVIATEYSTTYRKDTNYADQCNFEAKACTWTWGYKTCSYLEREDGTKTATTCESTFQTCTQDDMGEETCEEIAEPKNLEVEKTEEEIYHYWTQSDFHIVDLSDPADLKIRDKIVSGSDEESVSTLKENNLLHFTFKKPDGPIGSNRNFATYHFRSFDLSDPANSVVSADINIPGQLIAAKGNDIVTKDFLWATNDVDESINRLEVSNGLAYLKGVKRFDQSYLSGKIILSADDKLYITHYDDTEYLSIYPMTGAFTPISEIDLGGWLALEDIVGSRVIFTAGGGVLVVNTDDIANPYVQAFLPMRGWSTDFLLDGNQLTIAAGLYGIYEFDITTSNLPTP